MEPVPERETGQAEADLRLAKLYEIGKRLTQFESLPDTVRDVIALMAQALPLRSAVVVIEAPGAPLTFAWPFDGAVSAEAAGLEPAPDPGAHFMVLPIGVEGRPTLGVLQVDRGARPSEADVRFVHAVVLQLAVALDWRTLVAAGPATAEVAASRAGMGQGQGLYQALAVENARLLEKAEQAGRVRENLLAVVSHELRNHLTAILMSATLLRRRRPLGAEERRASRNMVIIQKSAQGMDRLIGDLLDVASIETGNLGIATAAEGAVDLATSAVELLEEQAAARSLRLTVVLVGVDACVDCDRHRIFQVFSNLIGNALKFTPAGGAITVRVEAQSDSVRFAVSDTGVGIRREDLPHVFERYWKGSLTAREGTGLGMAIVKGIVDAHGGTLQLESAPGVGTTVCFTLPLAPDA